MNVNFEKAEPVSLNNKKEVLVKNNFENFAQNNGFCLFFSELWKKVQKLLFWMVLEVFLPSWQSYVLKKKFSKKMFFFEKWRDSIVEVLQKNNTVLTVKIVNTCSKIGF